ncbi:hypothetical protein N7492_003461 [Penicillium capsulatum]|uniref:F-box domain-containing protein n=1 Tax=Penicillium capsulatum TaxID=69766 RepID=A0A9W9LW48_9EURO|nr:hypothetical protein N7492_003461 [Penicillium capsulatum]
MASLTTIPVEIQCIILRFLDPVGLIATSQTNTHFREIIRPRRRDFVERLVQLECDEQEGGITPSFDACTNTLNPDWSQPEWNAMRWACSGCLRLLSHERFENHSILRLAYRKPIPGSPAASPLTTWESTPKGNPSLPHVRRENRVETDADVQMKLTRRRYGLAVSMRWNARPYAMVLDPTFAEVSSCQWTAFDNMSIWDFKDMDADQRRVFFDQEARDIEQIHCGYQRRLRKCIECRYQAGQLKPSLIGNDRTPRLTYVKSLQYRIPTEIDRLFPRVSEILQNKRPVDDPPSYAVYRRDARDRFWAMYMVRCPGCERWKEARMFSSGPMSQSWKPADLSRDEVDEMRCHHCNARKIGRDALGLLLADTLQNVLSSAALGFQHKVGLGWHSLLFEPELERMPKALRQEIHSIADEPNALAKHKLGEKGEDLTAADLAFLRERYNRWIALRTRLITTGKGERIREREERTSGTWFYLWTQNYDILEAFYKWARAVQIEVDERPEKLVDWALGDTTEKTPPARSEPYVREPW